MDDGGAGSAAFRQASAICSGVIGRCGVCSGVVKLPVTAAVMKMRGRGWRIGDPLPQVLEACHPLDEFKTGARE
jgi:hypothetical protein